MRPDGGRRRFLQFASAAAAGAAFPETIARALSLPARRRSRSLRDIEHVVIFMQENRAFDHYFGTLRGVRGFADPRPLTLPGGQSVFHQPKAAGSADDITPFHLDAAATSAQSLPSLDHSWKGDHDRWKWYDGWITAKTPMTMGYFTREDIPFYYALADAFTICDAYHCSIFGPTTPNRLYLFTGTSGLAAGNDGPQVVLNELTELNETADPAHDNPHFKAYRWQTYAERLQAAGVSWRVYQEYDNYGDNALAYFANFRGVDGSSPLYQRGRAWADGSNPGNAATSDGRFLVDAFARDAAADRLPQISWIVAPYRLCEHPSAMPAAGEALTARLIAALTANPEVWAKTALILNYDENDGFFDHMPPPIPPAGGAPGKSTAALDGELYHGVPVGLGPRVPLIVVSPWTKGGWVNSQVFDHTSVLRLLEARFGVEAPLITPWRRVVTGDLTSVFDFAADDQGAAGLPDASGLPAKALAQQTLPKPAAPASPAALPRQEPGMRPARPLPYAFDAWATPSPDGLKLTIANTGAAGAALTVYPAEAATGGPWYYTVGAGKTLSDHLPLGAGGYDFTLHGPNGFLRRFRGRAEDLLRIEARYDAASERLVLALRNTGAAPLSVRSANAYAPDHLHNMDLAPGAAAEDAWPIAAAGHWYDISVTLEGDGAYARRLAGHVETGRPSRSDPALEQMS